MCGFIASILGGDLQNQFCPYVHYCSHFKSTLKLEAIVQNIKSKFLCIRILLLQRPDENQGVLITINIFFFCILSPQNLEHFAYLF